MGNSQSILNFEDMKVTLVLCAASLALTMGCPDPPPPVECAEGDMPCPGGVDPEGCIMPDSCVPMKGAPGNDGLDCPGMCPATCGADEMMCGGGPDMNGCPMPGWCMPNTYEGKDGAICSNYCPMECGEEEMICPGAVDDAGCMTGDMCMPMRDAVGCWAVCPMICPPADIMCPGGVTWMDAQCLICVYQLINLAQNTLQH